MRRLTALCNAVLAFGVVFVVLLGQPATMDVERHEPAPSTDRPALVEQHDCWTGEPPADMRGEIPGHVVLRWPGQPEPVYRGEHAVGVALDHLFGDRQVPGLVVYGFCR